MVMKREDRPKMIVLVVAIVAVLGYFIVVVIPRLLNSAPAPVAQNKNPTPTAVTQPMAPAPVGAPPPQPYAGVTRLASEMGTHAPTSRDPFLPVYAAAGSEVASARGFPPSSRTATFTAQPPLPGLRTDGPAGGKMFDPGIGALKGLSGSASLALDGVLMGGAAPVAIVRIDDMPVPKRLGDRLPGGLVITGITDRGIQMARDRKPLPFLEIGSSFQENKKSISPPSHSGAFN